MRAARLGAGAGEAIAAKRLHTHDRADHRAVDVAITRIDARTGRAHLMVDARMYAEGEAETGGVDLLDDLIEMIGFVADDVQDGAENFARQLRERFYFIGAGLEEKPVAAFGG